MIETDENAREKIQSRITKGLFGPGSDIWGLPDDEEIISDYPLQRYFTGVIFPEKKILEIKTEFDLALAETENETSIDEEEVQEESKIYLDKQDTDKNLKNDDDFKINQNNFFPNNIGLSFAIKKNINIIKAKFSFGLYYPAKQSEIKIKISEEGYNSFFDESLSIQLSFKEKLKYENGFMYLEKSLEGYKGGSKNQRDGDYKSFDDFKKKENIKEKNAGKYITYLETLLGRAWKRKNYNEIVNINIEKSSEKPVTIKIENEMNKKVILSYNIKVIPDKNEVNKKYVKIQVVNSSEKHPINKFSIKNELLNSKCLFQTVIKIESKDILDYKNKNDYTLSFDKEAEEIDFIYRNIENYAVGHNCSVEWKKEIENIKLETTFLPQQDIKDISNELDDRTLDNILNVKNLSCWGFSKEVIIYELENFAKKYKNWINNQQSDNNKLSENEIKIGNKIIERQNLNYFRLKDNILLLNKDNVFKAFQIANTSMLIQMIISKDENFCKKEKEIAEINNEIDFKSLDFFKDYNSENFKYRPFQLAFLLLNLNGIVNTESKDRKEIVDLIWFPTGGGKTEAYLAVTAFTIAYRRIAKEGFKGTTVIMRYTLRLLTAQQFERASRLISSLEFLRNQNEFKIYLKNEPISIGLWVGQSSTPNKIKVAKTFIEEIVKEGNKGLLGNPESKNEFQISSCPWCGTKLISKDSISWKYGFEESKKYGFKIKCINKKCFFSNEIPVQVVDEMLYKNPPTLLFGTVDKFAMLSWQEEGHNFFNSFDDDNLPPDLIIQDELHLLSGPLGSIVGIYESIIELLCTKDKIAPKIIASTATTRNTAEQISNLYGKRKVNIFPPSGITYQDSYFAKENNEASKRRYIGIIPTGKTVIDTQLQILAHLLVARLEIYADKNLNKSIDSYWTIVSYYNSLKDIGRISNKIDDEVQSYTAILQHRLENLFQPFKEYEFNFRGLPNRTKELTSRIDSSKIKQTLKEIEEKLDSSKLKTPENGYIYLNNMIDLVLATNMISVGIDISRLNVMLLNGMPKNIAEYIQASSRIGRNTKGLAITLLDPNRSREKSYFEHFKNFHQAFYKYVEPLSLTPFTENTIEKMLSSMIISFLRNKVLKMSKNGDVKNFKKEMLNKFKEFIENRFDSNEIELELFNQKLDKLANDFEDRVKNGIEFYKNKGKSDLLRNSNESDKKYLWTLMQSLREIDTNTYIQIKGDFDND